MRRVLFLALNALALNRAHDKRLAPGIHTLVLFRGELLKLLRERERGKHQYLQTILQKTFNISTEL